MTLPIIVLILGWCLSALSLLGTRVLVVDEAAQAARALGRGELSPDVEAALGTHMVAIEHMGGLVCVTVQRAGGILPIQARACAWDDGG